TDVAVRANCSGCLGRPLLLGRVWLSPGAEAPAPWQSPGSRSRGPQEAAERTGAGASGGNRPRGRARRPVPPRRAAGIPPLHTPHCFLITPQHPPAPIARLTTPPRPFYNPLQAKTPGSPFPPASPLGTTGSSPPPRKAQTIGPPLHSVRRHARTSGEAIPD